MADRTPPGQLHALARRDGDRCVMTATSGERIVPQHRAGGMGGRKDKHRLENLLWIDSLVNGLIESDSEWQATAKAWGVKVSLHVEPGTVPVFYRYEHAWFMLEGGGRRQITADDALERMLAIYGPDYLLWKAVADGTLRGRALYLRGRA